MGADVRYEPVEPGIVRITLDRPDRLNAYTTRLCRELDRALQRYAADDELRVAILTGAGRAFSSGGDIAGDDEYRAAASRQLGHGNAMREGMHAVATTLRRLEKPIVAMVNGPAVAGGLTLALLCDIRIAGESARLGDTSGRVGLLPDEGGAWLFPRFMGIDRALRMVMLHEVYDAPEALRLGLVTEVVPDGRLEARTLEVARAIASAAPLAVRLAKRMVLRSLDMTFDQSLGDAALSVEIANPSEDVVEGVRAFFEKRAPEFHGR